MNATRPTTPTGWVHTADNAVPPLGDDLAGLLDDLDGIHPGIDLIRQGFRLILTERLTRDQTQTLIATIGGSADDTDILGLAGAAIARLTDPDANPCLRDLDYATAADVRRIGAAYAVDLAATAPRDLVGEATARIDPYANPPRGGAR